MKRFALILWLLATPLLAVEPHEMLADPALEARARTLSKELRCLVCQNENIDSSSAQVAQDLRVLVRERLVEGDTDAEVLAYIVDRYGEYVLLRPTWSAGNAILWLIGPLALFGGAIFAWGFVRRRGQPEAADRLSAEEETRLAQLTQDTR